MKFEIKYDIMNYKVLDSFQWSWTWKLSPMWTIQIPMKFDKKLEIINYKEKDKIPMKLDIKSSTQLNHSNPNEIWHIVWDNELLSTGQNTNGVGDKVDFNV